MATSSLRRTRGIPRLSPRRSWRRCVANDGADAASRTTYSRGENTAGGINLKTAKTLGTAALLLRRARRSLPTASAVTAREQELRAGLEGFRTGHEELEGIGQSIGRVEGKA